MNSLKYYNEYGGFSDDGMEYTIKLDKEKVDFISLRSGYIKCYKFFG